MHRGFADFNQSSSGPGVSTPIFARSRALCAGPGLNGNCIRHRSAQKQCNSERESTQSAPRMMVLRRANVEACNGGGAGAGEKMLMAFLWTLRGPSPDPTRTRRGCRLSRRRQPNVHRLTW
jgi:hypothetical protein